MTNIFYAENDCIFLKLEGRDLGMTTFKMLRENNLLTYNSIFSKNSLQKR